MTQQTPVEWLALRYHQRQGYLSQDDIAEAKEMEKQTDGAKNAHTQTAVSWLVNEVNSDCLNSAFIRPELVEQANKMFEEQIIETWKHGNLPTFLGRVLTAEDYYKETFNK
jgi:hypothetical protein